MPGVARIMLFSAAALCSGRKATHHAAFLGVDARNATQAADLRSVRRAQMYTYCTEEVRDPVVFGQCRSSCQRVEKKVEPQWMQWEEHCQETAARWPTSAGDTDCFRFFECLYGCAVHGGDRSILGGAGGERRKQLALQAELSFMDQEDQCDALKCRSYCVRQVLGTCREMQFQDECKWEARLASSGGTKCDVDCSTAAQRFGSFRETVYFLLPSASFLFSALAFSL